MWISQSNHVTTDIGSAVRHCVTHVEIGLISAVVVVSLATAVVHLPYKCLSDQVCELPACIIGNED
jgi:hypothetical protein